MRLSNKAVQNTKEAPEKKFAVEGKIWKTTGRKSDNFWSKLIAFGKFMKRPPET